MRHSTTTFTPLNTSRSNILMEIKKLKELKWLPRLRSLPESRNRSKYYNFHLDHQHTTKGCLSLKQQIETLIKRGVLGSYIGHDICPKNNQNKNNSQERPRNKQSNAGTINIIVREMASGGDSSNGHKQYSWQSLNISNKGHGHTEEITFKSKDLECISFPHDDALVITKVQPMCYVMRPLFRWVSQPNSSSRPR